MKRGTITVLWILILNAGAAYADEPFETRYVAGGGVMLGKTQGKPEGALAFQLTGYADQKAYKRGVGGYGHMNLRLEISPLPDLAGNNNFGFLLTGIREPEKGKDGERLPESLKVTPVLGLEPAKLDFNAKVDNASHDNRRRKLIEWQPGLSTGLQLAFDSCRALFLARGGAAIGTLGSEGVRTSYGVSTMVNCPEFNAVGEVDRIDDKHPIDLMRARVAFDVPDSPYNIGIQGEAINVRNEPAPITDMLSISGNGGAEMRALIVVGNSPSTSAR